MAKMTDVAKHAGVSVKTVSRVLNNEPHVQPSLRQKVRTAINELGYVPSASARSLRSNRTYQIHLLSHSILSEFLYSIQFEALQVCQNAGYQMVVSLLDRGVVSDRSDLDKWFEQLLRAGKPDGFLLVPPLSSDQDIGEILAESGIPIVRIGPNQIKDDNATVAIDDRAAGRQATEHLIEFGHRRIAFVRGKDDQDASRERYKGYRDALYAAGIELDEALVLPGEFDFQSGFAAGQKLLSLPEETRPTGIFCSNDDMAAGVLVVAHGLGILVPDHLSVIGFDDSEIAEKTWPTLSTIRQPMAQYGNVAMEILTAMAGKKNPIDQKTHIQDFQLIVRNSTGPIQPS